MKHWFLLYGMMGLLSTSIISQNKETLYDFTELPQSLLLNPGVQVNYKAHLGIPLLSQIHLNGGFTGASAYDLFSDDGRSINEKLESTINSLKSNDYFTFTEQLDILNIGWRTRNHPEGYFSAGIYQELDLIVYIPKDFVVLAYRGNQEYINVPFRFSNVATTGELLTAYHFGYNRKVNKKLTIGGRVKLYSSMFNFRSTKNKGTFTTVETPNGNNFYQHVLSNIDLSVKTSGYASLTEIESENDTDGTRQVLRKFLKRSLLGGNLGLGVDVGFTYQLEDQWTMTGSVTDLGMIFYSKDVESYEAEGNYFYEGFNVPSDELNSQDILDELEEAIPIDTVSTGYTAMRPVKLNASLKYSFNQYDNGRCNYCEHDQNPPYLDALGVQLFSQFRPKRPVYAASLFYYKRLGFLRTKLTYTVDDFSWHNIGFLVSAHISKFNFYITANNLLEYTNLAKAQAASVQLGFNLILP